MNFRQSRVALAALSFVLASCGGGGSSGTTATPPVATPPPPSDALQQSVPSPTYASASAELAAFNSLNAERGKCGFGLLAQNSNLDQSASAHANYMTLRANEGVTAGHYEDQSKSGYTGYAPNDRATVAGYKGGAGEALAWVNIPLTQNSGDQLVRTLLASVYHLAGVFGTYRDIGLSVSNPVNAPAQARFAALVVDLGVQTGVSGQHPSQLVTYPCEGTSGVLPAMLGEAPDPFVNLGFTAGPNVGQPIYVYVNAPSVVKLTSASLVGSGGDSPSLALYHSTDDPNKLISANQAFVVPKNALVSGSKYSAVVNGTIDGVAFSRSFSFTTK